MLFVVAQSELVIKDPRKWGPVARTRNIAGRKLVPPTMWLSPQQLIKLRRFFSESTMFSVLIFIGRLEIIIEHLPRNHLSLSITWSIHYTQVKPFSKTTMLCSKLNGMTLPHKSLASRWSINLWMAWLQLAWELAQSASSYHDKYKIHEGPEIHAPSCYYVRSV